jgi:hypothetical protein
MRPAAALLVLFLASPAWASPFDTPPERYDETVNVALQQVGSDLRVRQTACTAVGCRFTAREVSVEVSGRSGGPSRHRADHGRGHLPQGR